MTKPLDFDVRDAASAAERRDEVLAWVTDHAGGIARNLALLGGGDYGRASFDTARGEWTLKYEGGDIDYLLFEDGGTETYVVSTKRPPDPTALADAMADYGAFVSAYNAHVDSLAGVLDGVSVDPPAVASTEDVVAERDRVLGRVRETCDAIAGQLHRYDGTDYGTFAQTIAGTRWELKWEGDRASYLRVGGRGGVYLLSQYEAPAVRDVRELAPAFTGFVEAYNAHVRDLEADLATVSL